MSTPEIDQLHPQEQQDGGQVEVRPDEVDLPQELGEQTGVQATPNQPTDLTDDQGQVVAQTMPPAPEPESIEVPADPETAQAWVDSKDDEKASTWLGVLVIRRVKQAILNGWHIVVGH